MNSCSLGAKKTQQLDRAQLKDVLAVARGDKAADLLVKNIRILDLVNGKLVDSAMVISDKTIAGIGLEYHDAPAQQTVDAGNKVVVPGFIDAHLHIESSMMSPFEFERITLPIGTTTIICDPHEITNVMGDEGFSWFLRCAEQMRQNMFVQVSSCVPALPGFETNGSEFELENMQQYKRHPNVLGLAEMMNFPGVINGDDAVLDKIAAFQEMNLDGHCPLLQGKALNAYIAAGIQNCHETVKQDEALEKLHKGMSLIIREGSVAKNLKTLAPLVTDFNSPQCMLCTDDRNPFEIFHEGHINYLVKTMINKLNIPAHIAYRLSSFSAAKHFGLKRLGLIAPGMQADFIVMNDHLKVDVHQVYAAGELVEASSLDELVDAKLTTSKPPLQNTIKRDIVTPNDFQLQLNAGKYNVIEIVEDEIITKHLKVEYDGKHFEQDDVLSIAVIERYGQQAPVAHGLVKGMNLKSGAIASSVAHDSHNIIVIGTNPEDMATAVNCLINNGGGFCVTKDEQIKANLPLPVAGLMSLQSAEQINQQIKELKSAFKAQGITIEEPFIQMAFLALPVIPSLKITDKGLVDVSKFEFIALECDA